MKATFLQKILIISYVQSCCIMEHTLRVNKDTNECGLDYSSAEDMDDEFRKIDSEGEKDIFIEKEPYIYLQPESTLIKFSEEDSKYLASNDNNVCCKNVYSYIDQSPIPQKKDPNIDQSPIPQKLNSNKCLWKYSSDYDLEFFFKNEPYSDNLDLYQFLFVFYFEKYNSEIARIMKEFENMKSSYPDTFPENAVKESFLNTMRTDYEAINEGIKYLEKYQTSFENGINKLNKKIKKVTEIEKYESTREKENSTNNNLDDMIKRRNNKSQTKKYNEDYKIIVQTFLNPDT